MTDFILAPAIVGICTYGFYKFVELLVHRKERLMMIEKISEIQDAGKVNLGGIFGSNYNNSSRFVALRFGAILLGIGLGLLIGIIISQAMFGMRWDAMMDNYDIRQAVGLVNGASTLIFGGIALLICFLVEQKFRREGK